MRIGRTIPPAAAPIPWNNLVRAACSLVSRSRKPETFTEELKEYFDVKYCFVVSSGKGALTLILEALHQLYPEKDEVLIPAFTCYSVPASIKKAKLKIRLCDINPETLDFDYDNLQTLTNSKEIKSKLLCVLPTHLFGIPADVRFCREAFKGEVIIIEDAAQAMGSELQEQKLGTLGDVGFFSLGRGKALSTMEGGIIFTNNDDLGKAIQTLYSSLPRYTILEQMLLLLKACITNILQVPALFWIPKSLPFLHLGETIYDPNFTIKKLSSIQVKLASGWLHRLQKYQKIRTRNIRRFLDFYQGSMAIDHSPWLAIDGQPLIRLPYFVADIALRDVIIVDAAKKGIGIMPAYPSPINEIPDLKNEFTDEDHPAAKKMSMHLLTIPTNVFMRKEDYKNLGILLKNHIE